MSNYELASSRNDTAPSHVKRRKGKREREGKRGGKGPKREPLLASIRRVGPKSPRASPSNDHELRAHFTAELSGVAEGIAGATEKRAEEAERWDRDDARR